MRPHPPRDQVEIERDEAPAKHFRKVHPVIEFRTILLAEDSVNLGVNAYVVKPVEFAEFVAAVKTIGAFWAVVNEPPPAKDHANA